MKVFMLSNPAAIHTQRWVSALAKRGVEIMLYSFYPCEKVDYYRGIKHVQVKSFWQSRDSKGIKGFILVKLFTYYRVRPSGIVFRIYMRCFIKFRIFAEQGISCFCP